MVKLVKLLLSAVGVSSVPYGKYLFNKSVNTLMSQTQSYTKHEHLDFLFFQKLYQVLLGSEFKFISQDIRKHNITLTRLTFFCNSFEFHNMGQFWAATTLMEDKHHGQDLSIIISMLDLIINKSSYNIILAPLCAKILCPHLIAQT